jgi:hypothetical protein
MSRDDMTCSLIGNVSKIEDDVDGLVVGLNVYLFDDLLEEDIVEGDEMSFYGVKVLGTCYEGVQ